MYLKTWSHYLACVLLLLSITSCSLFRSAARVEDIRVVNTHDVKECVEIATTEVSLMPGSMENYRSDDDLAASLEQLARETAAQIGGNTIAARGEIDNRSQLFTVYRCTGVGRR